MEKGEFINQVQIQGCQVKGNQNANTQTNKAMNKKIKGKAILPDQITLSATGSEGTTKLVMQDSCALNTSFGINTGSGTQEFDVKGPATLANLRAFLMSFVGVIEWVNYDSDSQTQLNNDITFNDTTLKGDFATYKVSVAASRRNSANDQKLQTVYINGEFAMTNTTSIGVPIEAGVKVDITIKFSEWIGVCEYLARAKNQPGENGSGC